MNKETVKKVWALVKKYKKTVAGVVSVAAAAVADGATGWQVVRSIVDALK